MSRSILATLMLDASRYYFVSATIKIQAAGNSHAKDYSVGLHVPRWRNEM